MGTVGRAVGRAYVVRAAGTGTGSRAGTSPGESGGLREGGGTGEGSGTSAGEGGDITSVYPYTLQGLTTALEDARFRSYNGTPQVVAVLTNGKSKVIRRFEDGHEVPPRP
jgi:hypothetical protein